MLLGSIQELFFIPLSMLIVLSLACNLRVRHVLVSRGGALFMLKRQQTLSNAPAYWSAWVYK